MVRLYALLFLALVTLAVFALIGCLSAGSEDIRALPRVAWILIILLFPLVGSIAWFAAGRPTRTRHRPGTWPAGGRFPESRRAIAPDDDPEFLRSLDTYKVRHDQEMFQRWEQDLLRREDELRRREKGEPPREDA